MTTLAWKLNRLRAMSTPEVMLRGRRALLERLERHGLMRPDVPVPTAAGARGRLLLADLVPASVDAKVVCERADRIMQGRWELLALELELGFPPDWNRDPKTGRRAPMQFGKSIDYRDEALVGDIKYVWEMNRHMELTTLAQAYRLSRQASYATAAQTLIASWLAASPHPYGPNWCSALELGVRLINWALAWELLEVDDSPQFSDGAGFDLKQRWLSSVFLHCDFIARNLSLHSSANNHLLGEYTGLLIAALRWPLWAKSAQWQRLARDGVRQEAFRQNGVDGVNREQAVYYQHEVVDMLLLSGLACRTRGIDFDATYWRRIESLLEFFASIMDRGGHVPMFGDADDGLIARLDHASDVNVYRSLLATGAVLFGRPDFKARAGPFDAKSRWLLGDPGAHSYAALPPVAVPSTRTAFPEGGYYVLGDRFGEPDEIKIVADAGPLGYLSIAAHGHADALALVASAGGHEVLIDSGTYAYHTERRWRDYFRGTRAHNTLCVDGQDQSEPGGAFLWLRKARVEVLEFSSSPLVDRLVACHDGYRRLDDPVMHTRAVTLRKADRELEVDDAVECAAQHRLEVLWHFAENCRVIQSSSGCTIEAGPATVQLAIDGPPGELAILQGQVDPPLGWVSRRFDRKVPTPVLRYATTVTGSCRIRSRFCFRFGRSS